MSDIDVSQVLLGVVVGIVATSIFHLVVEPLLPSSIRERIIYWIKLIKKHLFFSNINIELIVKTKKTKRFTETPILLDEFRNKIIQTLKSNYSHIYDDGSSVKFCIPIGDQSIATIIDFVSDVYDENNLVFESMEVRVSNTCKFKDFNDCAYELSTAYKELQEVMQKFNLELIAEFCMVCEVKTMPNIKVMLDTLNYNTIHCETPAGQNFELQKNKILYYDTHINRSMLSFIKKMIVTYS